MTVLSVDTGDLNIVRELAATGLITDATTNPLFVSQAGQNNDPTYAEFVREVSHPIAVPLSAIARQPGKPRPVPEFCELCSLVNRMGLDDV